VIRAGRGRVENELFCTFWICHYHRQFILHMSYGTVIISMNRIDKPVDR